MALWRGQAHSGENNTRCAQGELQQKESGALRLSLFFKFSTCLDLQFAEG